MARPDWWDVEVSDGEFVDDYDKMVRSLGHVIIAQESFGDYQGALGYILRDQDGRVGTLVIGYGSCSGCDALQDVQPWRCWGDGHGASCDCDWSGVVELRDSISSDIRWGVAPEPRDPNHWYSYDGDIVDWLTVEYAKAVAS